MSRTFVLLGAGFSRAVDDAMPLLNDLAQQIIPELPVPHDVLAPFNEDLEQWMSFLAQDQPWLDDSTNLQNQALFRQAAIAVARVISKSEHTALRKPVPTWLLRLALHWCLDDTSVATFNYDTLLERATSNVGYVMTSADLYRMALATREAPGSGGRFATETPATTTYSLFKLHGSTNWMYGGLRAPASDPVVMTDHQYLQWNTDSTSPEDNRAGRYRSTYADLEPMIVPPTGAKGPYYSNRALRAQWREAFNELQSAEQLVVIGYSFPPTDVVTRHFLATANFAGTVTVVDRDQAAVERIRLLAPNASSVTTVSGHNAVARYSDEVSGDLIRWRAEHVDGITTPRLMKNDQQIPVPTTAEAAAGPIGYDSPAMQCADAEVDRLWRGLRDTRSDRHIMRADTPGDPWRVAYLPKSGL